MHLLFIDTNVILDFLMERKPHAHYAATLFWMAEQGKVELYVSAISFNNSYYILKQTNGHKKSIQLIESIEELLDVIDLNRQIIKDSMKSPFADFEDAIQYFSALTIQNITALVTRNEIDFKHSSIPVLSPRAAMTLIINS